MHRTFKGTSEVTIGRDVNLPPCPDHINNACNLVSSVVVVMFPDNLGLLIKRHFRAKIEDETAVSK